MECALPGEKDASGSSKSIQDDIKKCAVIHSPFQSNKEENAVEGIKVIEAVESPDGKQDVEDDLISSEEETDNLSIGFPEIPKEAKQILRSIKGKPLACGEIMDRILRRVIRSKYNPTGLEISISSISATDWMGTSQGPGGVGKSVLAAMVACKEGVRKYYSGGIAWLDMGNRT